LTVFLSRSITTIALPVAVEPVGGTSWAPSSEAV
jgi:hypothetical protein